MKLALPVALCSLFALAGCAAPAATPQPSLSSAAASATRSKWPTVDERIARTVAATRAAFPPGWEVLQEAPDESACTKVVGDAGAYADPGEGHRVADRSGSAIVYRGGSTWFDEDESPTITLDRYVAAWKGEGLAVESGDGLASVADAGGGLGFAYGAAVGRIGESDQVRFIGGFDGDRWVVSVRVTCDTPGFPRQLG